MAYRNTEVNELLQFHQRWPSYDESIWPSDGDVESQDAYMLGFIDIDAEEELGSLAYKSDMIDELGQPRIPGGPIKERTIDDSSELMMKSTLGQQETIENSDVPCEQQWDVCKSLPSVVQMKEAEERLWKSRMGAFVHDLTWSRDIISISPEITGDRQSQHDELKSVKFQSEKAYVQHRQEQTAQVYTCSRW